MSINWPFNLSFSLQTFMAVDQRFASYINVNIFLQIPKT